MTMSTATFWNPSIHVPVQRLHTVGLTPVEATSAPKARARVQPDCLVLKEHRFRSVRFRTYPAA